MNDKEFRAVNSHQIAIYWDTSFINRYAKEFNWSDARATKGYSRLRNKYHILSPVNIFELLQISDEIKRETLIVICQNLFYERCFPSPEELILRHLSIDCPSIEQNFELETNNAFAKTWEDIVKNTRKTFVYDIEMLKKQKTMLYGFFKSMRNFIKENQVPKFYSMLTNGKFVENDIDMILRYHNIKLFEMSLDKAFVFMFIIGVLCSGVGIDPEPVREYWQKLKLKDVKDRLGYLLQIHPNCFTWGPAASIGLMARVQAEKSPNAGAMFDCLHIVYMPYSKYFFVCDDGFLKFRETLPRTIGRKITHFNELKIEIHSKDQYLGEDKLYL